MPEENPSIIHHVSIGTNDFERAAAFYDVVLVPLGCQRILEFPGAVAYGKQYPEFWVQSPIDGAPAAPGNGSHIALIAPSREAVDAFHALALSAGAKDEGAPGLRPDYGPGYYGAFVRDLDGHKLEAAIIPDE